MLSPHRARRPRVLNASFGSIVEIILYVVALKEEHLALVKASLTGTLLGTMLFIPGVCMITGGLCGISIW